MIDLNSHQTKIYEHEWSPSQKEWAYSKPALFYRSQMFLFVFVLHCWDLEISVQIQEAKNQVGWTKMTLLHQWRLM